MKKVLIIAITLIILVGCKGNNESLETVKNTNQEINYQIKNIIVQNPVINEITYEISEKLIGKYIVEDDPDMYFEINSNGEIRISLNMFSGYSISTSEHIRLVAYYTEGSTLISFQRVLGNKNTFPASLLSLDFRGDYNCTYFISRTYMPDDNLKFIKVD
ncbi:MAG: hypothetical protein LBD23_17590 [Oscillospiraceae bacterium]|jgi:hypothetical protein|nr:hypothetical protein [Oscillospiraceae bacterium]